MAIRIERREFVKRAVYAAPVILTLKAMPAFAAAGSGKTNGWSRGGGAPDDPSKTSKPSGGSGVNESSERRSGSRNRR
jgi:hypothetical protein